MIITGIALFISMLLESIFSNIIREFIPYFILAGIVVISKIKFNNNICIVLFILGVIYDLLYTNLLFIHGFIYIMLFYISNLILNKNNNFFKSLLSYYIIIFIYSFINLFFLLLSTNINFYNFIKTILNSLLINSCYFIFVYLIYNVINCLVKNTKNKKT